MNASSIARIAIFPASLTLASGVQAGSFAAAIHASIPMAIGQTVAARSGSYPLRSKCMQGEPMTPEQIAEARVPARRIMADYWSRATASDAADLSKDFRTGGLWSSGLLKLNRREPIHDVIARDPSLQMVSEPVGFARAGNMHEARGVWKVVRREDPTKIAAYYIAEFQPVGATWLLNQLEVDAITGDPSKITVKVTPYCEIPGDVEEARRIVAEQDAKRAARVTAHGQ